MYGVTSQAYSKTGSTYDLNISALAFRALLETDQNWASVDPKRSIHALTYLYLLTWRKTKATEHYYI